MTNILFIHGMFLNSKSWQPWQQFFSSRGFNCVAPSWPLHESEPEQLRAGPPRGLGELQLDVVIDKIEEVPMDAAGFHQSFANTLSRPQSDEAWRQYAVNDSRNVLRDCMGDTGKIDVDAPAKRTPRPIKTRPRRSRIASSRIAVTSSAANPPGKTWRLTSPSGSVCIHRPKRRCRNGG